jgi:glucokinase
MAPRRTDGVVAGIDLGGTQVRVAVASREGEIVASRKTRTGTLGGPDGFVDWAAGEITRLADGGRLLTAGVGAPGPCDPRSGVLVNPPNLPRSWPHNLPLGPLLSDRLGVAVHLENDANVAALAEFKRGAGVGSRNMVYITWSTGIGGGLILDGRLYSGSHGTAGEIGHMIIDPDGPLCACGQRGCLEALAGGAGIAAHAGMSAEEVFVAARGGDLQARAVANRAAVAFGNALVNLTNLVDPDVIVIGGGIAQAWRTIEPILNDTIRSSPFIRATRRPKLRRAKLRDNVGLVGAVEWALTNL